MDLFVEQDQHEKKLIRNESELLRFVETIEKEVLKTQKIVSERYRNSFESISRQNPNLSQDIQKIIENILGSFSLEDSRPLIDALISECGLKQKVSTEDIFEVEDLPKANCLIVLSKILIEFESDQLSDFELSLLLGSLERLSWFSNHHSGFSKNQSIENLKNVQTDLTEFPLPLVVISDQGEAVFLNRKFSELGIPPAELILYESETTESINGNTLKIYRWPLKDQQIKYDIFVLVDADELPSGKKRYSGSADLGIITSSIAHELNNPLAGMLAAIAVIEIEELLGLEEKEVLWEIKESVNRCKDLVEIFLGFSRAHLQVEGRISIDESLDRALDLLRGRMVESNIRLHLEKGLQQSLFQKNGDIITVGPAIGTMIFYLLLSEILTQLSHMRLVKQDKKSHTFAGLKLAKSIQTDTFELKIQGGSDAFKSIHISKLLEYLLELEGMKITVLNDRIVFEA